MERPVGQLNSWDEKVSTSGKMEYYMHKLSGRMEEVCDTWFLPFIGGFVSSDVNSRFTHRFIPVNCSSTLF